MPGAQNTRLRALQSAGVSIWLDTLSRELLHSGRFSELVREFGVTGATSNPTIFAKALTGSDRYDGQLRRLAEGGEHDLQQLFFALALDDIRDAASELRPAHQQSRGRDGFVSFECTPDLADDADATIAQALELWHRLDEPNIMIKVPATTAGLRAIEELTRRGVNVNVTLLFATERYEQVIDAYLRGLTARAKDGEPLQTITSVASFFVSRIDTKVDAQLAGSSPLRGRVAIANARAAYQCYQARFAGPEWEQLRAEGAQVQRPLWASTGTKNPAYSDVLYVSELIGRDVVNTMPEQTLRAFADHGEVTRTIDADPKAAQETLADVHRAGVDLGAVTAELEREGVQAFCDSYEKLLRCIETELFERRELVGGEGFVGQPATGVDEDAHAGTADRSRDEQPYDGVDPDNTLHLLRVGPVATRTPPRKSVRDDRGRPSPADPSRAGSNPSGAPPPTHDRRRNRAPAPRNSPPGARPTEETGEGK